MCTRKYTSKNYFHKLEKSDDIVIQKDVLEENTTLEAKNKTLMRGNPNMAGL